MASSARTSVDQEHAAPPATTSSPHSLSQAVYARRTEYTRPQKIKIKIGSWNVAACPGTEMDLAAWFVEGKGIDKRLAGLKIQEGIERNGSQEHIESVADQEKRRKKKESTIPKGDEGTIVGGDGIGIYVLGLQEVVDLNSATQYIGRVYSDSEPTSKWRKALVKALPPGYTMVVEQQLSGLLLFMFASPDVAPSINSVSTVSVGTGIMGYLGNKGAVTTRIVLGETTRLVFVNSHLASGSDPAHLDRRCWDVTQILQRTRFDPISWAGVLDDNGEGIGDEDFAFWFGDLNFRLDGLPGDDIRRILMLHAKGEYDLGTKARNKMEAELAHADHPIVIRSVDSDSESGEDEPRSCSTFDKGDDESSDTLPDPESFAQDPSQDPASLQATLDSLLPHDQLMQVQKLKKAFHDGWREGPITFLPTYKYDVGTMAMFDSSEKKRAPSWCDRILFRTRKDKQDYDIRLQETEKARLKDEEMKARGIDEAGHDESVLFDYDPDEDGEDYQPEITKADKIGEYDEYDEGEGEASGAVITKEGFVDRIKQDVYTSHQRVLSSDHKPLDAVFTLEYDAVVPELKAHIQQEVARELDRAENEGRPGVTLVVDHSMYDNLSASRRQSASSAEGVDFGDVAYLHRKGRSVTIANTGQVAATFSFVDRPSSTGEADRIGPPWLSVCFTSSETDEGKGATKNMKREITLEPGNAVNATLELIIDDLALVGELNDGKTKLDDVLVLRVTDGRDHFIPIRGNWLQSCLCRSIDQLIRIPEGGVRALVPSRDGSGKYVNRGQEVCWSAPRELFKLTETIETLTDRVIADSSMIESAQIPLEPTGWPFDSKTWLLTDKKARENRKCVVFEALDSDRNLNESFPPEVSAIERLEIVAEVLLVFLQSLTDGVVPAHLFSRLEQDMLGRGVKPLTDVDEIKAWVLDVLSSSPNHNISFVFLTSMLSRVASELCPVPKSSWRDSWRSSMSGSSGGGGSRSSMDSVRRSLSWKGRAPVLPSVKEVEKRRAKESAFVEVWARVLIRGGEGKGAKERRLGEERKREILEGVLKGC